MKKKVSVIPDDDIIIVEDVPIKVRLENQNNVHAIQWLDGKGHIESTDNSIAYLSLHDYDEKILPFVKLWEEESNRLQEEQKDFLQNQASEFIKVPNLENLTRLERNNRLEATDFLFLSDYPLDDEKRERWVEYRSLLRNMPERDGFPWQGPSSAPWPEEPQP